MDSRPAIQDLLAEIVNIRQAALDKVRSAVDTGAVSQETYDELNIALINAQIDWLRESAR